MANGDYIVNIPRVPWAGFNVGRHPGGSVARAAWRVSNAQSGIYSAAGALLGRRLRNSVWGRNTHSGGGPRLPVRKRPKFSNPDHRTPKKNPKSSKRKVIFPHTKEDDERDKKAHKNNGMPRSVRGRANYVRARSTKRRRPSKRFRAQKARRQKKNRRLTLKKMSTYVKNQIAKPEWSLPRRVRHTGFDYHKTLLNSVTYDYPAQFAPMGSTRALAIMNGNGAGLSYQTGYTNGVPNGPTDFYVIGSNQNKKFKYRWDCKIKLTNSGNSTMYLQMAVLKTKKATSSDAYNNLSNIYENKMGIIESGTVTKLKQDPWFNLNLYKHKLSHYTIHSIREVVINAGENSYVEFHVPWESFVVDSLLNVGDLNVYLKNSYQIVMRMQGQLSSDANQLPGLTPAGVSMCWEFKEYSSFLGGAETQKLTYDPTADGAAPTATSTIHAAESENPGLGEAIL